MAPENSSRSLMTADPQLAKYYFRPGAPGGLSGPKKLLAATKRSQFSRKRVEQFFKEHEITRQFYGVKHDKKDAIRNAVAAVPLDRIHVDLGDFTNEHSKQVYGLIAVDTKSRYMFMIPILNKTSTTIRKAFENLLRQCQPFRRFPFMKNTLFMSDLGEYSNVIKDFFPSFFSNTFYCFQVANLSPKM
jgi:hypothetical protein